MITEQELNTALQSLVGQEYDCWSTASKVFLAVRQLLEKDGITNLSYDQSHQTVSIKYKQTPFLEVSISKAKGKKHYAWVGSSYCDWTVKAINVFVLGQTHSIAGRIKEIDEYLVKKAEAADKQLQDAIKAVKALQELFPEKSEYSIQDLAAYIAEHRYAIYNQLKAQQN